MAGFAGNPMYSCRNCRNPVVFGEDLLSKAFETKSGPGYLFAHAMNVVLGGREHRQLITGLFDITSVYCGKCGVELGWTYVRAFDPRQRYKEGMFVIEKAKISEQFS